MISKITVSIVKKNFPIIKCFGLGQNLKLIHSFSDNNKKNPFQKFKRNTTPKTQPKPQNTQTPKLKENIQQQPKPQSNNSSTNQFNTEEKKKSHSHSKVAGFNKFKRQNNAQQKLNLSKKPTEANLETKKKYPEPQSPKSQNIKPSEKQGQVQNMQIKGFSKFKKTTSKASPTIKSETKKSNQSQKPTQQAKQQEPIIKSESPQQVERQNAYKKTEKKIEQDKEEWENFLQEQIKKNKDNLKNGKPHKKAPGWKNFDFTSKKTDKPNEKPPSIQQRLSSWQFAKTPQHLMAMVLLFGLAIYLVTIKSKGYLSIDGQTNIVTQEMVNLLQQGKIRQTWFLTMVESLSQDASRTKKYLCSTLKNGEIVKSQSNNDFEIEWNKKVDQYNIEIQSLGGAIPVIKKVPIVKKDDHFLSSIRSLLSVALFIMFIRSFMSGATRGKGAPGKGGLSGLFENTKSHRFRQTIKVKFNDVVGMNKAKEEIVEFIDFLKNAEKYNKLGAKIPRGALLTGPPGTGKTMLAKACAGESGVPFFTISGSEFMEMYVGVGAQRVRNLFAQAKEAAPSIIFIDEIDAVGKKRSSGVGGGGNDERDNTLNQLLVEMDGFDQTANVIVFAATNQKEVLDPALTRPGRFDRLIQVDLPDIEGRKQIFMVHLKVITLDVRYEMEQYAKRLATLTPGFSGADIKNLCNQAAIIAARNDKKMVSMIDFELASERIIGGVQKKSALITPETKRTVAYHECGHGVVSWFMEHASPLLKLTIIPRSKGALGFAQYLPNENQVYTRKQLEDQICVILGGRISQQIFFNKISTGASDDLQKAYKVAKAIVAQYGMGDKLGWLSFSETQYAKQYSKITQQAIDQQMIQIIYQCSIKTREIITSKKQQIQKLAEMLLKEETVDQRMIQSVLGERPFKSSKQYQDYIREKKKMDDQDTRKVQEVDNRSSATFKGLNLLKAVAVSEISKKVQIVENS